MNLIVAVNKDWGIGCNGDLLERLRGDLERFQRMTTGKVVIYGRETQRTFPRQEPLKNRTNIILTRDKTYIAEGAVIAHSLEELFELLKAFHPEDVFVIGGQMVYEQLLPFVGTCYVTKINKDHICDKYFPKLDCMPEWQLADTSEMLCENGIEYCYCLYKRKGH